MSAPKKVLIVSAQISEVINSSFGMFSDLSRSVVIATQAVEDYGTAFNRIESVSFPMSFDRSWDQIKRALKKAQTNKTKQKNKLAWNRKRRRKHA